MDQSSLSNVVMWFTRLVNWPITDEQKVSDRKSGVPFGGIQHLSMDLKEELRLDINFVKVN